MKDILQIRNLQVKVEEKKIVKGVSLVLKKGQVQAVLGPNAAGKSSLLKAIIGLSDYQIVKGGVFFAGQKINNLSLKQRADLGIALIYQSPPAIKGVKLGDFLQKIKKNSFVKTDKKEEKLLNRQLNIGFSGGEKKISELLQARQLKPKLVLVDEIDSGLDVVNLAKVARILKKEFVDQGTAVLLVTHQGEIMKYLKPSLAHVMLGGRLVCSESWSKVWQTIKNHGYKECYQCLK